MPIDKRKSFSAIVREVMDSYRKTGMIHGGKPADAQAALKQALAIAYESKR